MAFRSARVGRKFGSFGRLALTGCFVFLRGGWLGMVRTAPEEEREEDEEVE